MTPAAAFPTPGLVTALTETWRMAWRDLVHDRRAVLVFVLTVAAIVAPLLLLLGLKNGFIDTLRQNLLRDPRNLEIIVFGSSELSRPWLDALAAREDSLFVVPKTRTINASVDLLDRERRLHTAVEVLPTGPGDPLLPQALNAPREPRQVLVSSILAERLGIQEGVPGSVVAVIKRRHNGRAEHARVPLEVLGIVPERHFPRPAIFAHPALLLAAEDYRDGVRHLDGDPPIRPEDADRRSTFANARVYASSLDAVAGLAGHMRAHGIEVRTQAERIAAVQALERTLSLLFQALAGIGIAGCVLALGGALWVSTERKRRAVAMLRLFGASRRSVAALPVLQAVVIAVGGLLIAFGVFAIGASIFNGLLAASLGDTRYAARLGAGNLLAAMAAMLLVAILASSAAAWHASRVAPAEALRDP
ncbi:ABC transporter permease [uncultured Thiohalocapsa sp.]|uniref:ABC transporter permease n=1 Tax=uncultured Thiohalocapsa sp. TaxID=768990 RepID=UPI0025F23873|nr:ABC transporter permease [uncultured Thiohalocapsa sp.]